MASNAQKEKNDNRLTPSRVRDCFRGIAGGKVRLLLALLRLIWKGGRRPTNIRETTAVYNWTRFTKSVITFQVDGVPDEAHGGLLGISDANQRSGGEGGEVWLHRLLWRSFWIVFDRTCRFFRTILARKLPWTIITSDGRGSRVDCPRITRFDREPTKQRTTKIWTLLRTIVFLPTSPVTGT